MSYVDILFPAAVFSYDQIADVPFIQFSEDEMCYLVECIGQERVTLSLPTGVTDGEGTDSYGYLTWLSGLPAESNWQRIGVIARDEWTFLGAGDFNGDGTDDMAMVDSAGVVNIWEFADGGLKVCSEAETEAGKTARTQLAETVSNELTFAGIGDFNGDGTDDLAWYDAATGTAEFWQVDDKQFVARRELAVIV